MIQLAWLLHLYEGYGHTKSLCKTESRDRKGKNTVEGDKNEEDEAGINPALIDCFLSSWYCEF